MPAHTKYPLRHPSLPVRMVRKLFQGLIRLYQLTLSAFIGRQCRYLPTCSEYTSDAIGMYGVWRGLWMGLARFSRCGPLGASGYDPVPENRAPAAWYQPWKNGQWSGKHLFDEVNHDGHGH